MKRTIESFGKNCGFIKISSENKPRGLLFHALFSTAGKPSSEIVIDPRNGQIVHIKYYIFREKIMPTDHIPSLPECELRIHYPPEIHEKNYIAQLDGVFVPMISNDRIIVINTSCDIGRCSCYPVDEKNGVLFQGDRFAGIKMDEITDCELQALRSSNCLPEACAGTTDPSPRNEAGT